MRHTGTKFASRSFGRSIVRYLIVMGTALAIGILSNIAWRYMYESHAKFDNVLLLLAVYAMICMLLGSVILLTSKVLDSYSRKEPLYIAISISGLVSSILAFPPQRYGGIHIMTIASFGIFLCALDYYFLNRNYGDRA